MHRPDVTRRRNNRARTAWLLLQGHIMMRHAFDVLVIVLCSTSVYAQAGPPASEPERPTYEDRRFDEDWSALRDVDLSGRNRVWERLKFIPLGQEEQVWLTLAGQARERTEYYNQDQFGQSQPEQSGGFLLSRFRLSADLHASKYVRVFAEAKSSLQTDSDLSGGNGASFVDRIDLQNAFADVVIPLGDPAALTLRGGRQELLFGVQRLVGPSDWTNVRRTFQGVSGIVDAGGWRITPMWAELVVVDPHKFDEATPDNKLYGVYASGAATKAVTADLYWLGVDNRSTTFNGTSGRERRQTIGGRLWRGRAALTAPEPRSTRQPPVHESPGSAGTDFDLEAAVQFGTLGGEDIRAWMITANAGHSFASRLDPRPFVTMDFASGDDAPAGRVGTFNQLYPTNHTYLGAIDYVGRQNILSPSGGVSLRPMSRLSVVMTQFLFWRASVHDALYGNSGTVMRPGTTTNARYVGTETDLIATYRFDRHVLGYASYNHFFPGDFIRATGPARGSDYVYGALQYTF